MNKVKVKFCAGWENSESITKRLLDQFKTSDKDVSNIEFVFDDNYDVIIFNNYVTEIPKSNTKSYIFFHEPTWSGNHQKNFSENDLKIFGYNNNVYNNSNNVEVSIANLFYGGRGPWTEGWDFWNYNNLTTYTFNKTKKISSIVSKLGYGTVEHPNGCLYRERTELIERLINECDFIDYFGWGDNNINLKGDVKEKKDGLVDYKFSLCIENSNEDNYISEKFYDCILTNTIPIYFGCKNIKNFLPENGYINIDIFNPNEVISTLNYINENCDEIYEKMLPELLKIKEKYFNDFNFLKKINNLFETNQMNKMNKITLVTGLWDIGRGDLQEGWSRSFQHYLDKFQQLLQVDVNMIIFGDEELENFVLNNRRSENTQFVRRDLSWFKNNEFYDKIQKIRTNPDWYNQAGWLTDSTQSKLEMYNPLVMSKIYLLHDAKILDKFESEYMFWIDAGLTNTIHPGYFTHDKVLDKLPKLVKNFHFVCFPYETNSEIHGFKYQELCGLAGKPVDMVARAGFFGGKKDVISEINTIYYGLMNETLSNGLMGTEESLFTIMTYKYPNLISYSEIEGNGLMGKFFEDLKNDVVSEVVNEVVNLDLDKVGLYVITFNSPKQLEVLIQSMLDYDKDFINKPRKFLLDNSTDLSTTPRYLELCEQYGFEHIKKDNIGIVGGRVFVAEHFDETDLDCYWWFEDDMAFYPKKGEVCRNGFNRYVDNLYQKSLDIIKKENFDFLKLNFSEFFGDNSVQWSWYNVPQDFRQKHWPNNPKLPVQGLDPNSPKTKFDEIQIHKGLPYVSGEIYLCNWPIILSKKGNYKCYLETKWAHPFEQTLMSYCYQETVKGNVKPGLLLLTPTEHNRFEHYDGSLRKES